MADVKIAPLTPSAELKLPVITDTAGGKIPSIKGPADGEAGTGPSEVNQPTANEEGNKPSNGEVKPGGNVEKPGDDNVGVGTAGNTDGVVRIDEDRMEEVVVDLIALSRHATKRGVKSDHDEHEDREHDTLGKSHHDALSKSMHMKGEKEKGKEEDVPLTAEVAELIAALGKKVGTMCT